MPWTFTNNNPSIITNISSSEFNYEGNQGTTTGNATVRFTYAAQVVGASARTATLTIAHDDLSVTFTLNQLAGPLPPSTPPDPAAFGVAPKNVSVHIYPNPTSDDLYIHVRKQWQGAKLSLWANQGQNALWHKTLAQETCILSLKKYPTGVYTLKIIRKDGQEQRLQVIKE